MTTINNNQLAVTELFDLPKTEKVYDDFGCAFSNKVLYHGRIFLTENYICFNSSIIGFSQKFKIKLADILFIAKKKKLLKNSIEITVSDKSNNNGKYVFTSFSNYDAVYSRLKNLKKHIDIRLGRSSGKGISSSSSECEEEEVKETIISCKKSEYSSSSKDKRNSSITNNILTSLEQNLKKDYVTIENIENFFPPTDKEKITELPKIILSIPIEEFYQRVFSLKGDLNLKIYSESQGRWDIKIGEWIEIDSKNSDRESIFKILKDVKEKDIYYKDEQCTVDSTKDISKNLNLNNESKDLNITTINDIKNEIIVDYSLNEIKENKNLLREYTFIMKVKQVPFVDSSQIIKTQQITRNKSGFSFSSTTISKGVPYCDYFSFDETWDVQPILDNNKQEATILRIMYHVNFFKSTLFANTINLRSKEEYNKDIDNWKEWMSSKGINISSFNSFKSKQIKSTVLSHGLAKDNFDPYQEEYKNMLLKKKTTIEKIKEFFNFKTFHNKISNLLTIIKNNISGKDFVIFAMLGIVLYQSYIMNSRLDNFAK